MGGLGSIPERKEKLSSPDFMTNVKKEFGWKRFVIIVVRTWLIIVFVSKEDLFVMPLMLGLFFLRRMKMKRTVRMMMRRVVVMTSKRWRRTVIWWLRQMHWALFSSSPRDVSSSKENSGQVTLYVLPSFPDFSHGIEQMTINPMVLALPPLPLNRTLFSTTHPSERNRNCETLPLLLEKMTTKQAN
jgi:hypothetical protein